MSLKTDRYLLQGKEIDFDLVRKRNVRRNIHVRFEDDGRMQVTAPLNSTRKNIHLVLSDMHDQIVELRREIRERNRGMYPLRYRHGARHYYLGRTFVLNVWRDPCSPPHVALHPETLEVRVREWGEEAVREALGHWYREHAEKYFAHRMDFMAAHTRWLRGVPYELALRRMKRSWGTCSTDGLITLNPLLIKAPPQYVDYVIAHELCHLVEHNHSPAFYRLVERLIPNWETLRNALNERTHLYLRW